MDVILLLEILLLSVTVIAANAVVFNFIMQVLGLIDPETGRPI